MSNKNSVPIMECGHSVVAHDGKGNASCIICIGIHPGAGVIAKEQPDLQGREATCGYCRKVTRSRSELPFFRHKPDSQYDEYYCGCKGWD